MNTAIGGKRARRGRGDGGLGGTGDSGCCHNSRRSVKSHLTEATQANDVCIRDSCIAGEISHILLQCIREGCPTTTV